MTKQLLEDFKNGCMCTRLILQQEVVGGCCCGTYLSQQGQPGEGWRLEPVSPSGAQGRAATPKMDEWEAKRKWVDQKSGKDWGRRRGHRGQGDDKMRDGCTVSLLIHHWVMPHSVCRLRPPGGLWGGSVFVYWCSGGGVSFSHGWLSASRPYTLGWLKETDGPLPDSVSVSGALSNPAVRFQWWKTAFITLI